MSTLKITPIGLRDANDFVLRLHRHHKTSRGHKFSIGLSDGEKIVGVVIVGRPVARMSDDGLTLEVVRCCTDGTKNACSMLYRAAWRASSALGYHRLLTYTLGSEGGSSLRGAGFKCLGQRGGGSWSRPSRIREDKHPLETKQLWELTTP
jgi:hypothetical protein